jgi:DtxR family Mn-dependent transcriptional regulator
VLGLDWAEVHEDAEVLEHHISERVLEAMDRAAGRPSEDPHGRAIPGREGRRPRRALAPLTSLAPGARATVREIRDGDRARMSRWKEAGLVPGAVIEMRAAHPVEDVFEVLVGGRALVAGRGGLEGVMVEPGPGRRRT